MKPTCFFVVCHFHFDNIRLCFTECEIDKFTPVIKLMVLLYEFEYHLWFIAVIFLAMCETYPLDLSIVPIEVCTESMLTHWGRVTHICVSKLTIIGLDNGLSPGRCQAIIWTNAGILLIGPFGTNFSEILIGIRTYSFKQIHSKMLSAKCRPFCLGLNVVTRWDQNKMANFLLKIF